MTRSPYYKQASVFKDVWNQNTLYKHNKCIHIFTVCTSNHFGPNCAKCREKCQVCDPITGKCSQCLSSFFGDNCQNKCQTNCLDSICDQRIGTCNGCTNGFEGRHCEHQMAASITSRSLYWTFDIPLWKMFNRWQWQHVCQCLVRVQK